MIIKLFFSASVHFFSFFYFRHGVFLLQLHFYHFFILFPNISSLSPPSLLTFRLLSPLSCLYLFPSVSASTVFCLIFIWFLYVCLSSDCIIISFFSLFFLLCYAFPSSVSLFIFFVYLLLFPLLHFPFSFLSVFSFFSFQFRYSYTFTHFLFLSVIISLSSFPITCRSIKILYNIIFLTSFNYKFVSHSSCLLCLYFISFSFYVQPVS